MAVKKPKPIKPNTLQAVKTALRISSAAFDIQEITPIIQACLLDLKNAGVVKTDEGDPLILRAITLYAKANFGFLEDSEKFKRSYEMLKTSLCLAGDYNA